MRDENKIWELLEMCFYGHTHQVTRLLNEGIDINSIGRNGMTPLEAAKDGENQEIIELLLSLGAKGNLYIKHD